MTNTFAAQVARFVTKSTRVADAVLRESAQRLIEQAQTTRGAGGNLPLDTGFLRASGQASLTGMPVGPSNQSEAPGNFDYAFVIANMRIGDTLYWGWSAEYSGYMEFRYGFMRLAAQNWSAIVAQVAREVRK